MNNTFDKPKPFTSLTEPRGLFDLQMAEYLIARNKKLIKDYPSLEDSLKLLTKVISMEQN